MTLMTVGKPSSSTSSRGALSGLGYRVTLEPDSFVLYRLAGVAVFNGRARHTEHSLYRPIHKLTTPR